MHCVRDSTDLAKGSLRPMCMPGRRCRAPKAAHLASSVPSTQHLSADRHTGVLGEPMSRFQETEGVMVAGMSSVFPDTYIQMHTGSPEAAATAQQQIKDW